MSIVTTTDEAEEVARLWMKRKYSGKIAKVKFNQAWLQDGIWTLKADVEMKSGVLATLPWAFALQIDANTAAVTGYSENPRQRESADKMKKT